MYHHLWVRFTNKPSPTKVTRILHRIQNIYGFHHVVSVMTFINRKHKLDIPLTISTNTTNASRAWISLGILSVFILRIPCKGALHFPTLFIFRRRCLHIFLSSFPYRGGGNIQKIIENILLEFHGLRSVTFWRNSFPQRMENFPP